ncbi:hypothetical protein [Deinococcus aquaticus]|uniref:hypothetical protein n=1 Tax=Deinococcus aquaticus TaxID=328692 RepID=UPI003F4457BE
MSHDRLERLRQLNRTRFKRHTGIYPETFAEMEIVLGQRERSKKKSGRPPALNAGEQLLLTLEFWREYGLLPRIWTVLNRDLDSLLTSPLERKVTLQYRITWA